MIAGIFHQGSGLGNQLFRYITTRTVAVDKGYEWYMFNPQNFKGNFFPSIELPPIEKYPKHEFVEKKVVENGVDIRSYDPEINFVQDDTCIDGEFQDDKYWRHKLPEIDTWLAVEPITWKPKYLKDHLCAIGFRGGEYYSDPNLGLPKSYFDEAIQIVKEINPEMHFEVETDDPDMARQFFPDIPITPNDRLAHSSHSHMGYNWRVMRYAKYAIIANSSFYILPRILNGGLTIAPRYWARYNTKTWALPSNYYKEFTYI